MRWIDSLPHGNQAVPLLGLTPGEYLWLIASCEGREVRGNTMIQAKRADALLAACKTALYWAESATAASTRPDRDRDLANVRKAIADVGLYPQQ